MRADKYKFPAWEKHGSGRRGLNVLRKAVKEEEKRTGET